MSRSRARSLVLIAALALVAGCTHCPSFEREGEPIVTEGGPRLSPPVHVALVPSPRTDPRLERKLEIAFRMNDGIAVLDTGSDAAASGPEYVVRIETRRQARSSGANFLIAWPGFLVFAPAWHGFDWPYALKTHVVVARGSGEPVADYWLKHRWVAHHTSNLYGVSAGFGWFPPTWSIPALVTGIVAAVAPPETTVLDEELALREGDAWAEEVVGTVTTAIARDREEPRDGPPGSSEEHRAPREPRSPAARPY